MLSHFSELDTLLRNYIGENASSRSEIAELTECVSLEERAAALRYSAALISEGDSKQLHGELTAAEVGGGELLADIEAKRTASSVLTHSPHGSCARRVGSLQSLPARSSFCATVFVRSICSGAERLTAHPRDGALPSPLAALTQAIANLESRFAEIDASRSKLQRCRVEVAAKIAGEVEARVLALPKRERLACRLAKRRTTHTFKG